MSGQGGEVGDEYASWPWSGTEPYEMMITNAQKWWFTNRICRYPCSLFEYTVETWFGFWSRLVTPHANSDTFPFSSLSEQR
jgi:hypothetical protein